jgi:PAS domain S-box-containing protein
MLASIVQSSHDAIIGQTLDGVVSSWNPGAERLLGYSAGEIIGCPVDMLIPDGRRADEMAVLERIVRGDRVERYDTERLRKDGSVVAVSLTMSPIGEATIAIIGAASVSRDITHRQRADTTVWRLLDAAPDAVVAVDSEGRIAFVNAQAERLFGYTRDELTGQLVEILLPADARAIHPGHRSAYLSDPRPRPMGAGRALAARRRDGTEFPAEVSLSALHTDEGILVSAAVREVTERVEAQVESERLQAQAVSQWSERRLHQSQRLESLGQLAGGVAHDFNNLLAVILNYAGFVADEVARARHSPGGEHWDAVCRDVEQIQQAAERATRLTGQLLAFGRHEVVQPRRILLDDVVSAVEQLLRRMLDEDVDLVTSLSADPWPITADPGQIERVLVNLAVNARDAMPHGGVLSISTENLVVDDEYAAQRPGVVPGHFVRLQVSDTGIGMDRDVLARAFEPFFTTKPRGEGSGLGLTTVYGIITQARGQAQIDSEPGFGTTFTALLPAAEEVVRHHGEPAHPARSSDGETVLLVEDEDSMPVPEGGSDEARAAITVVLVDDHEMLTESFRRELGATGDIEVVAVASTAADGVAAAMRHAPDVVIMDHHLPDEAGVAAAARIIADRPQARILLLTGSDDLGVLQAALAAGCIGYLEKTSAFGTLVAAVRATATGEVVISPEHLSRLMLPGSNLPGGTPVLTRRENEVLRVMADGLSNQAIAERLSLSVNTIRNHVQIILDKLDAHSKLEAVVMATRRGLLPRR